MPRHPNGGQEFVESEKRRGRSLTDSNFTVAFERLLLGKHVKDTNIFLYGLITAYLLLATAYSVINPLFESPDEVWHYEYVRWLVEGNGLPEPHDVGHAPWHQEGSQPPLYYLTAAALTSWVSTDNATEVIRYNPHAAVGQADSFGNKNMMKHGPVEAWPWTGVVLSAHLARFLSILLGAVTVSATFASVIQIFPEQRWAALLAGAIVGLNPQFLFLSASVNNDNLVTCFCAVGIWYGLKLLRQTFIDNRDLTALQVLFFGSLAGGAALSKLSGLLLSGFVGLTLTLIALQRSSLQRWIRWGATSALAMVAISGWWYLRNWFLFGDPLALKAMFAILPRRARPPSSAELLARVEGIWHSLWGVFGWFNVVMNESVYWLYTGLTLAGFIGFLVLFLRLGRGHGNTKFSRTANPQANLIQLALLLIWIGAVVLTLLKWAQMRYPQGRLLFPMLSAAAAIISLGLLNWVPNRWRASAAVTLSASLAIVALIAPWAWIQPAYSSLSLPEARRSFGGNPAQIPDDQHAFGNKIHLVQAQFSATELRPGDQFLVRLDWRSSRPVEQDYSIFIHLIDDNEIIQAQSDSYPGQGNAPTSGWDPGQLVQDLHRVKIPTTVPSPLRLKVNLGLYDFESGERLPIDGANHWTLGFISLIPPAGDGSLPHSAFINFEDEIALVGYDFDRYVLAPGETLQLRLWWEALDAPLRDYKVFTHLVLPPDATWAQHDSRPRAGLSKTNTWRRGERIEDEYELTLPQNAPEGVYFVEVGIYDGATYERLQVNFSDVGIILGQVRVQGGGDDE